MKDSANIKSTLPINENSQKGSVLEFDNNWKDRKETKYNHWVKSSPTNQIQLAFRSHWLLFREILEGRPKATCLEVGCGRGSLSSYFADNGVDCTLLDTSPTILEIAKDVFESNGHKGRFVEGNALYLQFPDESFDVVTSIGLLEHFEEIEVPIKEQIRILKKGGTFFGYIVPEKPDNVQKYFRWLNTIARLIASMSGFEKKMQPKTDIFRSDYGSERYLPIFEKLDVTDIIVTGVYPLPMVSHSPQFPFSLMPKPIELVITKIFQFVLNVRKILFGRNPWMCDEKFGQAFLISCRKR